MRARVIIRARERRKLQGIGDQIACHLAAIDDLCIKAGEIIGTGTGSVSVLIKNNPPPDIGAALVAGAIESRKRQRQKDALIRMVDDLREEGVTKDMLMAEFKGLLASLP